MKAYLVLDITVHDYERFREYIDKIPVFISKHGGRYIIRGEVPTVVEGDWNPERIVVIEFPSRESANQFLQDSEVQPLFALRHETTTSKLLLVDGCLE
jgi:uncharacterized protein (DUF1330 family)